MSDPGPRTLLAAALAFALCAPSPATAQDAFASLDDVASRAGDTGAAARSNDPYLIDEITVTAKGTAADWPSVLATELIHWQDAIGSPADFQDLITRVPGIGATGQNGIFETFSIRGSGGNGILILVGGTPITAQRRAGVPVAFVEPSLLGEINVTRGPSTVHFGPGALGGAISIEPRWFDAATAMAGYANSGDEYQLMAGIGNESFSIAAARHQAGDSESANGTPLNTSFERDSASLQYRAQFGPFAFDALLLPSKTQDIGKSNSRYPVRDTTYPEDEHVLGRLHLRHDNGFEANVHGHDQSLLTYNQRPGTPDTFAYIESTDIGTTVQQTFTIGDFRNNVGVEFLGRRNVNGFDARGRLDARTYSLRDAIEDAWSLFGLTDWQITDGFAMEVGARFSTVDQKQAGADPGDSDSAFSAGAIWTPNESMRWTLSLSSGYRFATLEERFFSGVTPQGEIVGNPDLRSEHSLGADLGFAWRAGDWDTEIHAWRTDVDGLIQLFAVAPGVNGYTNVADANLHGVEGAVGWTPTERLSLRATGTLVRSKDESSGNPLYGSPPLTLSLEAKYDFSTLTLGAFYSHRWRMDHPGFEEIVRDAVDIVDLDLTWHLDPAWDVQLFVRNAFNEDYFATADVLSALAQERSIGLNLVWSAE